MINQYCSNRDFGNKYSKCIILIKKNNFGDTLHLSKSLLSYALYRKVIHAIDYSLYYWLLMWEALLPGQDWILEWNLQYQCIATTLSHAYYKHACWFLEEHTEFHSSYWVRHMWVSFTVQQSPVFVIILLDFNAYS